MSDLFLTREEVVQLTGWHHKQKQVAQLRKMSILFWINAKDAPIVPRSAIEGRRQAPEPAQRMKVVPLLFRTDGQPADRAEFNGCIPPPKRKN